MSNNAIISNDDEKETKTQAFPSEDGPKSLKDQGFFTYLSYRVNIE